MADTVSKTIKTQIRKKLGDGTYQVEHPETTIENVLGAMSTLGVKNSVFSGITSGGQYRDLVIPLGKIPKQYVKLEGQGNYNSMGVCLVDIEKGKVYIHEVYYRQEEMASHKMEFDLGDRSWRTVCFLNSDRFEANNPILDAINVNNDNLILTYYSPQFSVRVENILVEVL